MVYVIHKILILFFFLNALKIGNYQRYIKHFNISVFFRCIKLQDNIVKVFIHAWGKSTLVTQYAQNCVKYPRVYGKDIKTLRW